MNPSNEFLRRINGDRRTVPETHQRKPDPSEPWRYVCPDCGGQVNTTAHMAGEVYRCATPECRGRFEESELIDKKGENDG